MTYVHRTLSRLGHRLAGIHAARWLQGEHPAVYGFIQRRFAWGSFTGIPLTGLLCLLGINLMLFSEIAENIVNSEPMVSVDQRVTLFLFAHRTAVVSELLFALTQMGSAVVSSVITALVGLYLLLKRRPWVALVLVCIMIGAGLSDYYGKLFFHRVRPLHVAYQKLDSFSFPSGHSCTAVVLYGLIAYLLARHANNARQRLLVTGLGILLILTIGFSRVYLGEHFLSDVLGGYLAGATWLTLGIIWEEWRRG